ncbi:MAG: histidine phosphatase family protein [Planctomycetia bacterium]|nr:histidine phosphatase family protein [Planctomycetia bacterium]
MLRFWNFSFGKNDAFQETSPRILIIRPGETAYATQTRIQGNLNLKLTEEGRLEVDLLARQLLREEIQFLYASPCEPAPETAERIAVFLDIPRKILPDLRNQDQGLWQGMRVDELARCQPRVYRIWGNSPEAVAPPGGESFEDVEKRIRSAVTWILRRHSRGTVGVVVPEPLASYLSSYLRSEDAHNLWDSMSLHGQWEPVEVGGIK